MGEVEQKLEEQQEFRTLGVVFKQGTEVSLGSGWRGPGPT